MVNRFSFRMGLVFAVFILYFSVVHMPSNLDAASASGSDRSKENFNLGWRFYKGNVAGAETVDFNDAAWKSVVLPHTFEYTDYMANYWYRGVGWYRKEFTLEEVDRGKRINLYFEGSKTSTEVWVNGVKLDKHVGGFNPFNYDITDHVQFGRENVIAVKVDNSYQEQVAPEKPDGSYVGFNMFGGIYRDVYLIKSNKLYIPEAIHSWNNNWKEGGGVFAYSSNVSSVSADVHVKTWVHNTNENPVKSTIISEIVDESGKVVGTSESTHIINANQVQEFSQTMKVLSPNRWSILKPYLYNVKTTVKNGDAIVDDYHTTFGIRKTEWTKSQGFFLNDEHVKIFGVNHHQDYPFIGDAVPNNQHVLDVARIKEAGANFVRDAHYLYDDAFMDAADKLGVMQWVEIPGWGNINPSSFGEAWKQSNKDALYAAIRTARNHPSVVIWGAGINEMQQMVELETELNNIAKAEDPSRATSMGRNYNTSNNIFDVYGRNVYTEAQWNQAGLQNASPDPNAKGLLITEHTGHTYETWRDADEERLIGQALAAQKMTELARAEDYVHGSLIWEMHDHHHQVSIVRPHGLTDAGRIPKFAYYWHQSQSAQDNYDGSVNPMVFIANYWRPISPTKVTVFSNADQVRLSKWDGKAWKEFQTNNPMPINVAHPHFEFELGVHDTTKIKAEGLIDGKVVATHIVEEPGAPASVELKADTSTIDGNGSDIAIIEFYIKDQKGTVVPYSTNKANFEIEGPGLLIGGPTVAALNGANMILVKSTGAPGTITVKATSSGLEPGTIQLEARDVGMNLEQPEPEPTNLATHKPVTFSSEQVGTIHNPATNANDGNPATRWAASSGTLPQWWQVDLGEEMNINRTHIVFNQQNARSYEYKIDVSTDNTNFTPVVATITSNTLGDSDQLFKTVKARYVRITISSVAPSNFWASILEAGVFYDEESPPEIPASTLSAVESPVHTGQSFTVSYGLRAVENVYAQDITLFYDASIMEYVSARSMIPGVSIIDMNSSTPGQIRLIAASEGPSRDVSGKVEVIELTFRAKASDSPASGTIETTTVTLGKADGEEITARTQLVTVQVAPSVINNSLDINKDGKVSIGDLAIVAANYGKTSESQDWNQVKHVDISGDGRIDVADLAMIAHKIIE